MMNIKDEIAHMEARLAWMQPGDMAECDARLRAIVPLLPGMTAEDLDSLHHSLEALRRALSFASEVCAKRLENLASPESMYTSDGCHDRMPNSQLQVSA